MKKFLLTLLLLATGWSLPAATPPRAAAGTAGSPSGTVTDIDGNVYRTVKIGAQEWMAGNLRTTRLNDGTPIPWVKVNLPWGTLLTPAYTWYQHNAAAAKAGYGALYNWYAVATGRLCPKGWRVPTDADWLALTAQLGGKTVAGGKLKRTGRQGEASREVSNELLALEQPDYNPALDRQNAPAAGAGGPTLAGWSSPNRGATNESGVSALPGGRLAYDGNRGADDAIVFENQGRYGYWWTATETSSAVAWFRLLYYDNSHISRMTTGKSDGLSVCCVRE